MSRVPVVVVAGIVHVAAAARMVVVVLGTCSSSWVVGGGGRVDDLLVTRWDHAAAVKRERGRRDRGPLHATARSQEFERAARHRTTHRLGGAHSFFVFQEVPGSFSGKPIENELFTENHAERLVGLWDGWIDLEELGAGVRKGSNLDFVEPCCPTEEWCKQNPSDR